MSECRFGYSTELRLIGWSSDSSSLAAFRQRLAVSWLFDSNVRSRTSSSLLARRSDGGLRLPKLSFSMSSIRNEGYLTFELTFVSIFKANGPRGDNRFIGERVGEHGNGRGVLRWTWQIWQDQVWQAKFGRKSSARQIWQEKFTRKSL